MRSCSPKQCRPGCVGEYAASWEGKALSKYFNRGDIVRVCLDPTEGKELQGQARPALVVSTAEFNALGLSMVAPITQGGNFAREQGFAVSLSGCGSDTQGVVLVNMLRSLDLAVRKARVVESVPDEITDEVLARISAIFE